MRCIKKNFLVFLSVLLAVACVTFPVHAVDSSTETIYFDDGSYLVIKLSSTPSAARASTASGKKDADFYKSDGTVLWSATVYGTFTYDGTTATATSASYSYQIYDSSWKFKSGNAYCSGNQAIADCSFTNGIFVTRSVTIVLSCSPTGVLS